MGALVRDGGGVGKDVVHVEGLGDAFAVGIFSAFAAGHAGEGFYALATGIFGAFTAAHWDPFWKGLVFL